jgi:hypothetical protein
LAAVDRAMKVELQAELARMMKDEQGKVDLDRFRACFPQVVELMTVVAKRKKEQEAHEAAQQRRQEAQEAYLRTPRGRLERAYGTYVIVKLCHEECRGYLSVYINDVELERARSAVSAIEAALLKEEPMLDTEAAWQQANKMRRLDQANQQGCNSFLRDLLCMAPSAPTPPKDFGRRERPSADMSKPREEKREALQPICNFADLDRLDMDTKRQRVTDCEATLRRRAADGTLCVGFSDDTMGECLEMQREIKERFPPY